MLSDLIHARSSFGFYFVEQVRGGFLWKRLFERIYFSSAIFFKEADLLCLADWAGDGLHPMSASSGAVGL